MNLLMFANDLQCVLQEMEGIAKYEELYEFTRAHTE
jgi:hypothetical protein